MPREVSHIQAKEGQGRLERLPQLPQSLVARRGQAWLSIWTILFFSTTALAALPAEARGWPVIKPIHEKFSFIAPNKAGMDTPYVTFFEDENGVRLYKIECHNGDYDGDSEINFSGEFQCALFAVKGSAVTSGDLLAADTKDERSTDWWNRGRLLAHQLSGICLSYPEYSTRRQFKLRGMIVTLSFEDIGWLQRDKHSEQSLEHFTLNVDAVPDKSISSSRAELPAGPKPPKSCYP